MCAYAFTAEPAPGEEVEVRATVRNTTPAPGPDGPGLAKLAPRPIETSGQLVSDGVVSLAERRRRTA